MSHSQFHCTGRAYLDMHGLIFETSICYWQDQPGRSARSGGWDRRGPPLAHSLTRTGEREAGNRRGARTEATARPQTYLRGRRSRRDRGRPRTRAGRAPAAHPHTHTPRTGRGRGDRGEGGGQRPPPHGHTTPPGGRSGPRTTAGTRARARASGGEGPSTGGSFAS